MLDRSIVLDMTHGAYGQGRLDAGRFACDRVRCLFDTEPRLVEETRRNECFYVVPFGSFAREFTAWRVDPGVEGVVDAPTILPDGEGLLAIARVETGAGTRWRWIGLDRDGAPRGETGEVAGSPVPEAGSADGWRVHGLQALAQDGGVTVGGVAVPADGGRPRMVLGDLDAPSRAFGRASLAGDPDPGLWTGAWPLARRDGRLLVLPSLGPTAAMVVGAGGRLAFERLREAPRAADAIHAATPLVPFGGGSLALAREFMAYPGGASFDLGGLTAYDPYPNDLHVAHRFVAFDGSLRMTGLSHPFVFSGLGREACGGLAVVGGHVVMSWVRDGAECWIGRMPTSEVERLLSGIEGGLMTGPFLGGPSATGDAGGRVSAAAAHRRTTAAARGVAEHRLAAAGGAQAGWFAALQPPADAGERRISVLLPTRGRPGPLARSIGTLLERALRPEEVEILLAVDKDDAATLAALPSMPAQVRAVVVERRGYVRLQEYMNLLARLASGYWTVMWNDDNLMETQYWDEVISREPDCIGALLSAHGATNVTPVIPRHWLALVGHYSLHNHNDTWWEFVAMLSGLGRVLEIEFVHDRFDLTGNNADQTYEERTYQNTGLWSSSEHAITQDARMLQEWIAFERSIAGELASPLAGRGA